MYIDTHCHLNFSEFAAGRPTVIGNAKKAGVKKFIVPGADLATSKRAVNLAEEHPRVVFAAIGFHPYEAQQHSQVNDLELLLQQYNNLTMKQFNNCIVAIGECGLDYHRYKGEVATGRKDVQKRLFEEQLLLALKYNLPVIIHCREAFDDLFMVLDSLPTLPRGVLHCFSGGLQDLRMAKERNLMIGFDGNVTYSKHLQMVVPHVPFEVMLLETDAPYLTPVPHRGRRNEPKYLPLVAKKIAEIKGVSVKELQETTTNNASNFFQLS